MVTCMRIAYSKLFVLTLSLAMGLKRDLYYCSVLSIFWGFRAIKIYKSLLIPPLPPIGINVGEGGDEVRLDEH